MMTYGSLERSIMVLNTVINDVCFDRALSETELDALEHVVHAKEALQRARAQEAAMAEVIGRLTEDDPSGGLPLRKERRAA